MIYAWDCGQKNLVVEAIEVDYDSGLRRRHLPTNELEANFCALERMKYTRSPNLNL
jgi:hypothetical protein